MRVPRSSIAGEGQFRLASWSVHGTKGQAPWKFEFLASFWLLWGGRKAPFPETKGGERHVFLC